MSGDQRLQFPNTPDHHGGNAIEIVETETEYRIIEPTYRPRYDELFALYISATRRMEPKELHQALQLSKLPFYPRPPIDKNIGTKLSIFEDGFLEVKERVNPIHLTDGNCETRKCGTQRIIATATLRQAQEDRFVHWVTSDNDYRYHVRYSDLLDHEQLAEICIKYLQDLHTLWCTELRPTVELLDVKRARKIMEDAHEKFPLLLYAVDSLFIHISAAFRPLRLQTVDSRAEDLFNQLNKIFEEWKYYSSLKERSLDHEPRATNESLLDQLVEHDILQIVSIAMKNLVQVRDFPVKQDLGRALHIAVNKDHYEILDLLLISVGPGEYSQLVFETLLPSAAFKGSLRSVESLLQNRADHSYKREIKWSKRFNGSALIAAIKSRHRSAMLVQTLLNAGADPNRKGGGHDDQTPLQAAVEMGYNPIIEALVATGAIVDGDELTSLLSLAEKLGHTNTSLLLDRIYRSRQ